MTQRLDLTDRQVALVEHQHDSLPEVHLHHGKDSGVFLVLRTPEGLWKRAALKSYYDGSRGRGQRRLQMFHLRSPGTYAAISYGGSYGFRKIVLFELGADREIVVRGEYSSIVQAMAESRKAVTA